jgi:hypothetical protein
MPVTVIIAHTEITKPPRWHTYPTGARIAVREGHLFVSTPGAGGHDIGAYPPGGWVAAFAGDAPEDTAAG